MNEPAPRGRRLKGKRPEVANQAEPPDPIEDRRVSGAHWWDPDRIAHMEDLPKFCPNCAEPLGDGISVEYWESDNRVYRTWCKSCEWVGDIVKVTRVIGHEPAD